MGGRKELLVGWRQSLPGQISINMASQSGAVCHRQQSTRFLGLVESHSSESSWPLSIPHRQTFPQEGNRRCRLLDTRPTMRVTIVEPLYIYMYIYISSPSSYNSFPSLFLTMLDGDRYFATRTSRTQISHWLEDNVIQISFQVLVGVKLPPFYMKLHASKDITQSFQMLDLSIQLSRVSNFFLSLPRIEFLS